MPVTVSVTYRAPKGDSKVCELYGRTFFDDVAIEIEDTPDNEHAIAKLSRNKFFEVIKGAVARHRAKAEPDPEPLPDDPEPDPEPVPEPEPKPTRRYVPFKPEPRPELDEPEPEMKRKGLPAARKPIRRLHK